MVEDLELFLNRICEMELVVMKLRSNTEMVSGNGSRVRFGCQHSDNYLKQASNRGQDVPLICREM